MAGSKSSQTTRNVVIALLALWSVISLIIIVVWATSPDLKSASQCRAELQAVTETMEGAKVVWTKDKKALEELVEQGWENQTILNTELSLLVVKLEETNRSLGDCEQENVLLNGNITVLETEIEEYEIIEANLTSEITLQKDHIDSLKFNLTQIYHQFESSEALRSAAESQQKAAVSQMKACDSGKHYLEKKLHRCNEVSHGAPVRTGNRAPGLYASPLVLFFCAIGLHLLSSCE